MEYQKIDIVNGSLISGAPYTTGLKCLAYHAIGASTVTTLHVLGTETDYQVPASTTYYITKIVAIFGANGDRVRLEEAETADTAAAGVHIGLQAVDNGGAAYSNYVTYDNMVIPFAAGKYPTINTAGTGTILYIWVLGYEVAD